MTVTAPPRPPRRGEPLEREEIEALVEALIEEARQRARRRRRRYMLVAAAVAATGAALLAALGRTGTPTSLGSSSATRANPAARALRTGGQLTLIGIPRTGRQQPVTKADGWYGLSTVGSKGELGYLVRCPGRATWCGWVESLDWSPNGRRLALSVTSIGGPNPYNGIHVVDIVAGVDRQLTHCAYVCDWFDLDWSPDGTKIAYVTNGRIYVIAREGSKPRLVETGLKGALSSPSWSPDGERLAFANRPWEHGPSSVYIAGFDGADRTLVARYAAAPAWSPDGTIAVASRCEGIKLLTMVGRDVTPGQGSCRVIGVPGVPVWSPDGKQMAVTSSSGTFVTDADGRNLRLLTREAGRNIMGRSDASWQPLR